ncbi:hypothetical protein N7462_004038 [Penicillium macrosclerotiorum]|uniref:uncharacterized protein n=1 Tax=Penicillium macrosclerotiorum TaxID=303699 RepID=UPI00254681B2|nr:uncharacterized protein N7462_004038 [Penicillium macrosclerotiorum]KAJ5689646.1 hypothetical protein N7462_004038 [Penicillium macrosclerotiorum]
MRHFDAWVIRDPYSIWHYYTTGRRWQDTVRELIHDRKICSPSSPSSSSSPSPQPPLNAPDSPAAPEIRHMIWEYVFGADTLHLVQIKDKVRHVRCTSATSSLTHHRHCCPLTPARWRVYDGRVPGHSDRLLYPHTHAELPRNLSNSHTALLRTSRLIHAEAAHLLYANSTFDVDDLYTFIAFAGQLPPAALAAIRAVTVQWMPVWAPLAGQAHAGSIYGHTHSDALWTQFWGVLAALPGLETLALSIDLGRFTGTVSGGGAIVVSGQRVPLVLTEPWLLPLLNVRGLKGFELAVTARCDAAAKGVIEGGLCRDAVVLRDQLRAVMCAPKGTPLAEIKELGLDQVVLAVLEEWREEEEKELARRSGPRLMITAA